MGGVNMIKKVQIALLLVALMIFTYGCQAQLESDEDLSASMTDEISYVEAKEVTDPSRLQKFWEDYIYHALHTVMNTDEYTSATELNSNDIISYCWNQYVEDLGYEYLDQRLEYKNEESSSRLFPFEIAQEYMQSYFNIDSIDVSQLGDDFYDSEKNAYIVWLKTPPKNPAFQYLNSRGTFLEEVIINNDGTITFILNSYFDRDKKYIERTIVCTLKERQDGSLYFISGSKEYFENERFKIVGSYEKFEKIDLIDLIDDTSDRTIIGEVGNNIIIQTGKHDIPLILVDSDTMSVKKELFLHTNRETFQAKIRDDKIIAKQEDRIIIYDYEFAKIDEILIPQSIFDAVTGNSPWGYDISTDHTKIVFADEGGLKLFDLITNEESILVEAVLVENPKWGPVLEGYYYPRFINDDKAVIATRPAYESYDGYYRYNFADQGLTRYDSFEMISTWNVLYDTGMITNIRTPDYDEEKGTSNYIISYLDFTKGEKYDIEEEIFGRPIHHNMHNGDIYVGENHAAFLTQYDNQSRSPLEDMWYVHRLDLRTMEIQTNLLTVNNAGLDLLGVLENGEIIFFYDSKQGERWIGVI
jgi:hypothetical protein